MLARRMDQWSRIYHLQDADETSVRCVQYQGEILGRQKHRLLWKVSRLTALTSAFMKSAPFCAL